MPLFSITDFISLEPYQVRAFDTSETSWRSSTSLGSATLRNTLLFVMPADVRFLSFPSGFLYSSVFSFVKITLVRTQPEERALPPCGCRRHPQCKPITTFRLELCQPMTSALQVGERRLRHVAVSWAALRQANACQHLRICGTETKGQGCAENLIRGCGLG